MKMRKFMLLSFVCLSAEIFAQKSFFGAEAGINVANQREHFRILSQVYSGTQFFENSVRPAMGIFYHRALSEALAIRLQVNYMGLGYSQSGAGKSNLDINYLTLPISIRYSANRKMNFSIGSYVSFTLGGSKINGEEITKTYHKNDFGFSVGGEYDVYKNFALAANYFIGTKNIWLADKDSFGNTFNYTNRALQLTLIYKFKKPS